MLTDFKKTYIALIKKQARSKFPNAIKISHIIPRAYCVSRPGMNCGVFACPEDDSEPQIQLNPDRIVHNNSVKGVRVGEWCVLAYVSTELRGENYVIKMDQE